MLRIQEQIKDLKLKHSFFSIGLVIVGLFLFAALATAINAAKRSNELPSLFRGVTFVGNPPDVPPPPFHEDEVIEEWTIGCTNETLGNETIIYDGKTTLGFHCQPTGDSCRTSICLENQTCSVIFSNSTFNCSIDSDCGNGEVCEGCICRLMTPCMIDADCGEIIWTECIEDTCVDGFCVQNFTMDAKCATDEGCAPGWICRNCTCVVIPPETCTVDAECGVVEWTECIDDFCDGGSCFSRLASNATCVVDSDCGETEDCKNCTCQEKFVCETNTDCGEIDWTTCIEWQCIDNTCFQNFTSGSSCVSGEPCGVGFTCKDCNCEPEGTRCSVDEDCPVLNFTTCVENLCEDSYCVASLKDTSQCSDASLCSTDQFCNEMCQCETMSPIEFLQAGTFTVGGPTTFSVSYGVFGSGALRWMTYNTGSNTASTSAFISSVGAVLDVANRPTQQTYFSVNVIDDPGFTSTPTFGTMIIAPSGQLFWTVGGFSNFQSGNQAGILKTDVSWVVGV